MKSEISKFYKIETWDRNPVLRAKCEEIKKITPELEDLADDMLALMYENDWVGLAYKSELPMNWCPNCKTNLTNEELEDGKCERRFL